MTVEETCHEIICNLEIYVTVLKEADDDHDLATIMQGFGGISNILRKAPRWQLVGVENERGDAPYCLGPDL